MYIDSKHFFTSLINEIKFFHEWTLLCSLTFVWHTNENLCITFFFILTHGNSFLHLRKFFYQKFVCHHHHHTCYSIFTYIFKRQNKLFTLNFFFSSCFSLKKVYFLFLRKILYWINLRASFKEVKLSSCWSIKQILKLRIYLLMSLRWHKKGLLRLNVM